MTAPGLSLFERAESAAEAIREGVGLDRPRVAVVLGSGLGSIADEVADRRIVPYAKIPHFPLTGVAGHKGNLVAGSLSGVRVVCLQGRIHGYEGHDLEAVTFPIRVLKRLGVDLLILTAATGGIRADLRAGELVRVSDHLNLSGANPLRGPNDERFGPRFPDMTHVYTPRLRDLARVEANRLGLTLREGVYACLPGPSYETPAEIRMLRAVGADVVGMSTVPEAIVARQMNMEVLAFALVTNAAAGTSDESINHEDVIKTGQNAVPELGRLIGAVIARSVGKLD